MFKLLIPFFIIGFNIFFGVPKQPTISKWQLFTVNNQEILPTTENEKLFFQLNKSVNADSLVLVDNRTPNTKVDKFIIFSTVNRKEISRLPMTNKRLVFNLTQLKTNLSDSTIVLYSIAIPKDKSLAQRIRIVPVYLAQLQW
ncbi:MAG: hypothetical protein ACOVNR_02425 [Chitinophagaceae bacterium]